MWSWRSGAWYVFLAALLAMATYMLFRDMTIIGSDLAPRLAGNTIAAIESAVPDAERLTHLQLSGEGPSSSSPSLAASQAGAAPASSAVVFIKGITFFRSLFTRARAQAARPALFAAARSADPF